MRTLVLSFFVRKTTPIMKRQIGGNEMKFVLFVMNVLIWAFVFRFFAKRILRGLKGGKR